MKIYFSIHNFSKEDLRGIVRFFDGKEEKFIGGDQTVAVVGERDDMLFTEFTPSVSGDHEIAARIIPWDEASDNPDNNKVARTIFIDNDFDKDGTGDLKDIDDDNDGVNDAEDTFPLNASEWTDTDGDGAGNNADSDDDNDHVPDIEDAFPLNAAEWVDTDQDGIGDNADDDLDGDELSNDVEKTLGTDPKKYDTDGDKVNDAKDDFPLDASKTFDTDKDGTPDEDDSDDDGDGISDTRDAFPKDASESKDTDADGIGDNTDPDDDNDGLLDERELLAGTDSLRSDTDDDGFSDSEDEVPTDPNEHKDSDHDGLGDNADPNDANAGPVVVVHTSSETAKKGQKVFFDASPSYDPEGRSLSYKWILPDGSSMNSGQIEYIFHRSGEQTVSLTVTDAAGESRTKDIITMVDRDEWEKYLWVFIIGVFVAVFLTAEAGKKKEKEKVDV